MQKGKNFGLKKQNDKKNLLSSGGFVRFVKKRWI